MKANSPTSIARPIVPTSRQSGHLTPEELEPKVQSPVFADGIDLHAAARAYLDAQIGKPVTAPPVLRDAVRSATHSTLERDVRILIDHDTRVWEALGHKNFQEYFLHETGQKISASTAWRRRLFGETALLLGARGCPQLIPSQRQCELVRKHLTRDHGILFLLQLDSKELHRMGETKLQQQLEQYRKFQGLPAVGQRVDLEDSTPEPNCAVQLEDADARLFTEITKQLRRHPQHAPRSCQKAAKILLALQNLEAEALPTEREVIQLAEELRDKMEERANHLGQRIITRIIGQVLSAAADEESE